MHACRDQARNVSHVDHEFGSDPVRNGTHAREIDDTRIGTGAGNDELWPEFFGPSFYGVVIEHTGFLVHAVPGKLVCLPRKIEMRTVSEMPAMTEIHSEYPVTGG